MCLRASFVCVVTDGLTACVDAADAMWRNVCAGVLSSSLSVFWGARRSGKRNDPDGERCMNSSNVKEEEEEEEDDDDEL